MPPTTFSSRAPHQQAGAAPELVEVLPIPGLEDLCDPEFNIVMRNTTVDRERAEALLEALAQHWTVAPAPGQTVREWSMQKLNMAQLPSTHDALVEVGKDRLRECANMLWVLRTNNMYTEGDYNRDRLQRCFCACKLAYETIEREMLLYHVFDEDMFANAPLPKNISRFSLSFLPQSENHTPTQELILYTLGRLQLAGYRRLGSDCYREIKVDGMSTHAWEIVGTIEEFVYSVCNKDQNGAMWEAATKTSNAISHTVEHLTKCYEDEFVDLEPNRHIFSFRNGQYNVSESAPNAFHRNQGGNMLDSNEVAIRFWDVDFDEAALLKPDWRDIETPLFDEIFEYQGYDKPTMECLYAMLGRLLFPVGERDGWQVVPFFLGVAGCGKSTVAGVVKDWYPPQFVSVISGNMEDKFGLAGIVDTMMCQCLEVTAKFPLNRGVWQSMVTGESINVPRKNTTPVQGPWKVPMVMAGNEVPNYEDKSGSVHRRIAVFSMKKAVDRNKSNPKLEESLKRDPAALLVKCSRAYLELSQKCGDVSFWRDGVSSLQMRTWHKDLLQSIDNLSAYMASARVARDPLAYTHEDDLRDDYRNWLTQVGLNFKVRDWNPDHLSTVYDRNGLSVEETRKPRRMGSADDMQQGRYVIGLRLVNLVADLSIDGTM